MKMGGWAGEDEDGARAVSGQSGGRQVAMLEEDPPAWKLQPKGKGVGMTVFLEELRGLKRDSSA